jgi:hypothetical protein
MGARTLVTSIGPNRPLTNPLEWRREEFGQVRRDVLRRRHCCVCADIRIWFWTVWPEHFIWRVPDFVGICDHNRWVAHDDRSDPSSRLRSEIRVLVVEKVRRQRRWTPAGATPARILVRPIGWQSKRQRRQRSCRTSVAIQPQTLRREPNRKI